MEKSDKVRILSHFSPSHEPFVILYLVPHFSEVLKCGKVRQSKDNVTLSYTPIYEMRIKRSGSICRFYSCNSFYIFLNAILSLDNNSVTRRY